ncbi:MAG: TonB-dependent receptor [Pseudomonadota bacterium]
MRRWTLLAVFCGVAGTAVAHDPEKLEEIVVEGRWDQPLGLAVSASEGVVGQAEIDVRPRLRTGDLLEAVPGLVVTQHSGSGKSNQLFLRGFNLDHGTDFATWIDGMPINQPTHGHGQGYTDLNFIIPELVEKLEFRKGPYYADVSDFSSAGAAFFSVMSSLDSAMIKTGIGENDFGRILVADSFEAAGGTLLAGLQSQVYNGPWSNVSENLEAYTTHVRYSREVDDTAWSVLFMGYDADWDSADQVPLRAVQSGLVDELGTIDDTVGGTTDRYSLSARWHRDVGDRSLTVRGYAIDYSLELFSNFTYFLDDPVNGDQFEQVDDRNTYGGDVTWRRRASDDLVHTVGVSFRYDDIDEVGLFRTQRRERFDTVRLDTVAELTAGVFYDLDYRFNDRWRGSFGLRADTFDFDVSRSNVAANTGTATDTILSPKLNLIATVSDSLEAYISAGRGFHSNDARGTVITIDPASGDPAERVDPTVPSTGAEIGLRWFDGDRFNVSAALWYLELDSELLFVGDAGNTEASGASRRYGLEIPVYLRINDTWLIDVEIALTESEFTDAPSGEREIPGSLDRVIAAGISGEFENGMYGSVRVRHFGERPLIESGEVKSSTSTVINAALGYKRESFDVRLELLNLADSNDDDITYFYESRLPGEPADGIADVHFHPIEPRMVRAYLTWYPGF